MTISAVISAFNEEKNIKDCLESIKDLVDEIIVVDNSSTDKTKEIAQKYTDKIFTQVNDPSKIDLQKNFGFSKAKSEYILCLDADERLTKELRIEIEKLDGSSDGYWMPRKNFIFGKWIQSEMWWPDYQLRLFKLGKGSYEKGVHNSLKVSGKTSKLNSPLIHINYTSVFQFVSKLNNYTDIEAERIIRTGYKLNSLDAIRFPAEDFLKTFFLQKGFREGLHGLVLSVLQAFYMEVVFAKLWERKGFEEVNNDKFLENLKKEMRNFTNKFHYWFVTLTIENTSNPFRKSLYKAARKMILKKIIDK